MIDHKGKLIPDTIVKLPHTITLEESDPNVERLPSVFLGSEGSVFNRGGFNKPI